MHRDVYSRFGACGDHIGNKVRWKKVLYDAQNQFADNFTPEEYFLDAIVRNKNVRKLKFHECLEGGCQVAAQTCFVQLLAVGYFAIDNRLLTSFGLLAVVALVCVVSYPVVLLNEAGSSRTRRTISEVVVEQPSLAECAKRVFIFAVWGLGLSPVFQKLTDTVSTDTIHSVSAFMLFVHLAFHEYGSAPAVSFELSLSAGLFAAVCLASRLPTSIDSFAFMSLAVEVFALLPPARRTIKGAVVNAAVVSLLATATVTTSFVILSPTAALINAITLLATAAVCPALFFHWQSFKDTIHGPWDEAVPNACEQ